MHRRAHIGIAVVVILGAAAGGLLYARRSANLNPSQPAHVAAQADPTLATQLRLSEPTASASGADRSMAVPPPMRKPVPVPARVRVHVQFDEQPVAGATVRIRTAGSFLPVAVTKTDAQGLAQLDGVVLAEFVVEALADGFRVQTAAFAANEHADDDVVELFLERGIPFDGRVIDAVTGAAIAGASVAVTDGSETTDFGPTDAEGRFHVCGATEGDSAIHIVSRARGYLSARLRAELVNGMLRPAHPVLRLAPGGLLVGSVRSASGQSVPAAIVRAKAAESVARDIGATTNVGELNSVVFDSFDFEGATVRFQRSSDSDLEAITDADGRYQMDGLRFDVPYDVVAEAAGHAASSPARAVRVSNAEPKRALSIQLERPATVLVLVRTPDDVPLSERARILLVQRGERLAPAARDPDGRFRFEDFAPGVADVFVRSWGLLSSGMRFEVVEGRVNEIEVEMRASVSVEGVVLGEDGKPLAGARVLLDHLQDAATDEWGRFRFGSLRPGAVSLTASWTDGSRRLGTHEPIPFTAPTKDARIVLRPLGGMRARLVTPVGTPFEGNATSFVRGERSGSGGGANVAHGVVEATGIRDGRFEWTIRPEGFARIRKHVEVHGGGIVDLGSLKLEPGFAVHGTVRDADGKPVSGARIRWIEDGDRTTESDATGRFVLVDLPREKVTLRVRARGFAEGRSVVLESESTNAVELRLQRPVFVEGSIKSTAGVLASHAGVALRRPDARPHRETTYGSDGVRVELDVYDESAEFRSDESGQFYASVPPGAWRGYWTDAHGNEHRVGEWTFVEGSPKSFEIMLPK